MKYSYIIPAKRVSVPDRIEEKFLFQRNTETGRVIVHWDGTVEVKAEKSWNSSLQAAAQRSLNGKGKREIALKRMGSEYEKAHKVFSDIYKNAEKTAYNVKTEEQYISKKQDLIQKLNNLRLEKYSRKGFYQPKPTMEDAVIKLEEEYKNKNFSLFGVNTKKCKAYVDKKKNVYFEKLVQNWEQLRDYHEFAQDVLEAKMNYKYAQDYQASQENLKKQISQTDIDIAKIFLSNLAMISLPFELYVEAEYDGNGHLNIDASLDKEIQVPGYKLSVDSQNRWHLPPLTYDEEEKKKKQALTGAAVLLLTIARKVSRKITDITVSFWKDHKSHGLFAVIIDRNTEIRYNEYDAESALFFKGITVPKFLRDYETFEKSDFLRKIKEHQQANHYVDYDNGYISIEDAKLICQQVPSEIGLKALLDEALKTGAMEINAGRKYVNMLKEFKI